MKKKLLSIVLTLTLCLSLLPMSVLATEEGIYPDADALNVQATAGDGQITVTWVALDDVGEDAVKSYTVYCYDDNDYSVNSEYSDAGSHVFKHLTNGVTYYVGVTATYTVEGEYGPQTVDSETEAVPLRGDETVPGAPTNVSATAGNGSVTVSWTAPEDNGGAVITDYEVDVTFSSEDEIEGVTKAVDADTTICTVDGLTGGKTYTVVVRAINAKGYMDSQPIEVEVPVATYDLWVGGVQVTADNAGDVLGNGTAVYDAFGGTLTLNGFTYNDAGDKGAGIYAEQDLNIVLAGANTIVSSGYYGIYVKEATLTIDGTGTLDVTGSDYGIYTSKWQVGALTIGDRVTVNAKSGDVVSGSSYGIRADGALTICDKAVVTAQSGSAPVRSCGIYAYTTLNIRDNAKVTATGGGSSTAASDRSDDDDNVIGSYGVRTTTMAVSGGSLTATGTNAKYDSCGIYTQTLEITGGRVTATGGTATNGPSIGIEAAVSVDISRGTVTATGGDATANGDSSCGIQTGGTMTVSSGSVTAKSGSGGYTYGVEADQLAVTDGVINATAADAVIIEGENDAAYSFGIQALNGLTIEGGTITATGGNASNFSYGIQTTGEANFSDGDITAAAGSAAKSYGLRAWGAMSIADCDLTTTGETAAVYAAGDITLEGVLIAEPAAGYVAYFEAYEDEWHAAIFNSNDEYALNVEIEPGYVVSFSTGCVEHDIPNQEILAGGQVKQPEDPTLAGHEFAGWYYSYYDSADNYKEALFDFGTPVVEDLWLYAKWNWVGPLYVGGVQVTEDNAAGNGWSYDADTNTLTLTNADITGGYEYKDGRVAGIYAVGDLDIELVGDSAITAPDGAEASSGIRVKDGDLSISGGGTLTTVGGKVSAETYADSAGIAVDGQLSIHEATVIATGGNSSATGGNSSATGTVAGAIGEVGAYSSGVYTEGGLNLDFDGILTATGGTAEGIYAFSSGMEAHGDEDDYLNVSIYDGCLEATGGTADGKLYAGSTGITLSWSGLNVGGSSDGSPVVTLTGGDAEVSCDETAYEPYAYSNGINVYAGSVSIDAGTVTVSGGSWEGLNGDGCAIYARYDEDGSMSASGGTVDIECGEIILNPYGYGFSGTRVTLTAEDDIAIYAQMGMDIDDALTISDPEGGEVMGQGEMDNRYQWDYYTIVDKDGKEAKNVIIEPLIYKVTIEGLSYGRGVLVPVGRSVNETYCERLGVEDFSEALNTKKDGYTFVGWYTEDGAPFSFDDSVSADVTIYPRWVENTYPDYGYAPPTYTPVVENTEGGAVSVSPRYPEQGDKVTVTAEPEEGMVVEGITVTDRKGNPVEVSDNGDGTYSFVQPAGKVTITVTFKNAVDHTTQYSDLVEGEWYHEAVNFVLEEGLMNGIGGGKFDPTGTTSRGMLMTMLARMSGVDTSGGASWYEKGMEWAVAYGISDGANPEAPITREQLATMLYRYEQSKGGGFQGTWMFLLDCTDRDQISDWAYEAMCWMNMHKVINGSDNKLNPSGEATRAEVAQMLMNYLKK